MNEPKNEWRIWKNRKIIRIPSSPSCWPGTRAPSPWGSWWPEVPPQSWRCQWRSHAPRASPRHPASGIVWILISAITRFNQLIVLHNGCLVEVCDTLSLLTRPMRGRDVFLAVFFIRLYWKYYATVGSQVSGPWYIQHTLYVWFHQETSGTGLPPPASHLNTSNYQLLRHWLGIQLWGLRRGDQDLIND